MTSRPDAEGFRNEFTIVVALQERHEFRFDVQDWDLGPKPLTDEEVLGMARGLIHDDRVELHGTLNGAEVRGIIDPEKVVGIFLEPAS